MRMNEIIVMLGMCFIIWVIVLMIFDELKRLNKSLPKVE